MKSQYTSLKWIGMALLFAIFISFTFLLPPVLAQEGNPKAETPIPSTDPSVPEATPESLEIPEIKEGSGFQSFMSLQAGAELGGDWAAQVNISDTERESCKPLAICDKFSLDSNPTHAIKFT
ncbi:MAG: hypothetical protein HZB18_02170 [Chloroflexi bacterium]|nr:hypothetical protein [Chloroflexota bacterium]